MFNRRNLIIAGAAVLVVAIVLIFGFSRTEDIDTEVSAGEDQNAERLYKQARALKAEGDALKAKEVYLTIYNDYPDYENITTVQKELEALNMDLIFSNVPTPNSVIHEVTTGDTLGKLAKKYGTTVDLIKINNGLKSDIIRVGQKLRVWTGFFNIYVDKSQNKLFLKQDNEVLKVYNVSTGENSSTPVGEFKVTSRLVDPVWFNRGVVVPPESPENVLGSRWLGFDIPGYGIHGTIEPETIGQQVTAGCVRMRNSDVEELYSIIPTGTKVVITN